MNAEELYEEIKAFLRYAGLAFADMDKVQVTIEDDKLVFHHGRTHVVINVNENQDG